MEIKNKKIRNNQEFINAAITQNLPIKYICDKIGTHFDTFKKYYPNYNGNLASFDFIREKEQYTVSPKTCLCCHIPLVFNKRKNIYCSSKCAATINNRKRGCTLSIKQYKVLPCVICNKDTIVEKHHGRNFVFCGDECRLKRREEENIKILSAVKSVNMKTRLCLNCNNIIVGYNTKYCSVNCWKTFTFNQKTEKEQYYLKCKFKFNVYHYPNFFNLSLIEEFGWYSPTNKSDNLDGVSRDHCLSINDGFTRNIDPSIICHPANCRLIKHRDNQQKKTKSIYTLEQLLVEIERFNKLFSYSC